MRLGDCLDGEPSNQLELSDVEVRMLDEEAPERAGMVKRGCVEVVDDGGASTCARAALFECRMAGKTVASTEGIPVGLCTSKSGS